MTYKTSTKLKTVFAVALCVLLLSEMAQADFYLQSKNREFRCTTLGNWLEQLEANSMVNLFDPALSDEDFRSNAAYAFSDPLFSRAFGRSYDDLDNGHRRQIYSDLARCHSEKRNIEDRLRIPFGKKSVLASNDGQKWLEEIYRTRFEGGQRIAKRAQSSIGTKREKQCEAQALSAIYSSQRPNTKLINIDALDSINTQLRPLLSAERVGQAYKSNYSSLSKAIADLEYNVGRAKQGKMRLVDRELYLKVAAEELQNLNAYIEPANAGRLLEAYIQSVEKLVNEAIARLDEIGDEPVDFEQLAIFDATWIAQYSSGCATWDPIFQHADNKNPSSLVQESITRLRHAIEAKLYSILIKNRDHFNNQFQSYDSKIDFADFDSRFIRPRGAAYLALDNSDHIDVFIKTRSDYYRKVEIEEAKRAQAALEARVAILSEHNWPFTTLYPNWSWSKIYADHGADAFSFSSLDSYERVHFSYDYWVYVHLSSEECGPLQPHQVTSVEWESTETLTSSLTGLVIDSRSSRTEPVLVDSVMLEFYEIAYYNYGYYGPNYDFIALLKPLFHNWECGGPEFRRLHEKLAWFASQ